MLPKFIHGMSPRTPATKRNLLSVNVGDVAVAAHRNDRH